MGIGDGAFTKNPDPNNFPFDPIPPPDRILSALLANQGVNSGRLELTKEGINSGIIIK